jgi:hypothetical protein
MAKRRIRRAGLGGVILACAVAALVSAGCFGTDTTEVAGVGADPMANHSRVDECQTPGSGWIWCDDFDADRLASYFEFHDADGAFQRIVGVGVEGSGGMRARWAAGQVGAGALHLALGRTPSPYMRPADAGTADYRELYWRLYVKLPDGWVGGGGWKLSRAFIFASPTWAQAMIAHVWSGGEGHTQLFIDPARGTDEGGRLVTTTYNDGPNLSWLGAAGSVTPIFDAAHIGSWTCVEAHVRLNDAGQANGVFELWIDDRAEAQRTGLNFLGNYAEYGLNAVFVENYWNDGAPAAQERYIDNFVVSTDRIGC